MIFSTFLRPRSNFRWSACSNIGAATTTYVDNSWACSKLFSSFSVKAYSECVCLEKVDFFISCSLSVLSASASFWELPETGEVVVGSKTVLVVIDLSWEAVGTIE